MKLNVQKRLSAQILKCSPKRVRFDATRLDEIKESITKYDIKNLIKDKAIKKNQIKGISRVRARIRHIQKTKGKRRGQGKRKGTKKARNPKKRTWINKIRAQRNLIKNLKEKEYISKKIFRNIYNKAKGGFFRSKRHIKIYLQEHNLLAKKE